jgi:hypoxanthine phosphoribosyltransferase
MPVRSRRFAKIGSEEERPPLITQIPDAAKERARLPSSAAQASGAPERPTPEGPAVPASGEAASGRPAFAHPSEEEFARILDFYQLAWRYEPHSFALRYAEDGRVIERFTPDFYLPELDLYIELTTLKQSLVTKKNRKLRRLRELYPDVKIKLLYNRDYRNLLFKYGLAAANKRQAETQGETRVEPQGPQDEAGAETTP